MIAIVDSGISNVSSVLNMLRKIGAPAKAVRSPEELSTATGVILPGVGHFQAGVHKLFELDLVTTLKLMALEQRRPVLGICLGMQLLLDRSDEGNCEGLQVVKGRCVRFRDRPGSMPLPVPHMGWRSVRAVRRSPLLDGLPEDPRFYFVHSYHAILDRPDDVLLEANYGARFTAAYHVGNVAGVQFHPEKSHAFGEQLLRNFVATVK